MNDDRAPITNITLTVQFAPPATDLNPIQLGDLYTSFRAEFPVYQQVGRAGPMPYDVGLSEIELVLGAPRNSFSSPDHPFSLLFQNDRFSCSWDRRTPLSESPDYPGFESVMETTDAYWIRLRSGLQDFMPVSEALVGEVMYTNAFDIASAVVGGQKKLSSFFSVINPDFHGVMAGFDFAWNEPLFGGGHTQIRISGANLSVHSEMVAQLQMIARFPIAGSWSGLRQDFAKGHAAIAEIFTRLTKSDHRPT